MHLSILVPTLLLVVLSTLVKAQDSNWGSEDSKGPPDMSNPGNDFERPSDFGDDSSQGPPQQDQSSNWGPSIPNDINGPHPSTQADPTPPPPLPAPPMPHTSCRHPRVRREFRELSEHDRERYILATVCLREQPSRLSTRETQWVRDGVGRKIAMPSLYDDFVYVHWRVAAETHGTPQFLPWHRIFISLYERALIRHCGWDEGIPFWDWSHDSQSPETSILWSARFYGRPTPSTPGSSPDSSPSSSHFIGASNFTHLFATWPSPHPIDRNWVQGPQGTLIPATFSPVELEMITGMARYGLFRSFLETLPHNLVHSGVGGDGGDFATAPTSTNDPIFWLHHGNIDRHWARWQHHHLHIAHTYEGYPDSNNATVDDMMHYSGMYPDVPVRYALRYGNESNGYDEEGDVLPDAELLCYRYSNSIVPDVVITDPRLLKPIWDVPTSNDDVEELEGLGRDRWQGQEIQGSDDEGWDDGRRGGEDEDPEQGWAGGQGPGRQDDDEWQDGSRTSNSDTDASRKRRRRPQQADDQWQDEDRRRGSQRLSASRDWRANLNLAAFPSPRDDQSRPNQSGRPAPGLDGSPPWMQGSGQPGDDQRQQQQEQEQSGGRDPFFASGNWGQGQSDNQWQDGRGGAEPNWTPSSQRPSNNDQWDPTNRPMGGNNDVPPRGGSNDSRGGTPQDAPPRRPDGGSNDGSRNPSNTPNTSRAPPHTGPSNGGAPTPSQGQPASTNPNANPSTPKDPNFTPLPFTNGLRRRASSSFVIGDVMQMYREKKLRSSSANTASVEKRGEHRYFAGYGAHGHPTNKHTPHALDRSDYFNLRHHGEVSRQTMESQHYNEEQIAAVREKEEFFRDFVDEVNKVPDFVSTCALRNTQFLRYRPATDEDVERLSTVRRNVVRMALGNMFRG